MGHVSYIQFKIKDRVRSGQDQFRLFPKSPDYKYVPYVIHERRTSSRLANNNLGASPPLILGFHPSKRHAALIERSGQRCSCFYLGITRTEAFFMASSTSYLGVHSTALVDLLCFVAYRLRISCCLYAIMSSSYASSRCIELAA